MNFVLFVSPRMVAQENSLVEHRSSQSSMGGGSFNPHDKPRDCLHFSDEGRSGNWSKAVYTVKVGEPGVEPRMSRSGAWAPLASFQVKHDAVVLVSAWGLMPSPQILLASLVNPSFKAAFWAP